MVDEALAPPTIGESVKSSQVPDETTQQAPVPDPAPQATENSQPAPSVSVLLCVADMRRLSLCRTAVNQLLMHQTYRNFELVIVNSAGKAVTNRQHALVREFEVDPADYPTLGALRNYGLERCEGDWVMPIDDDDYQHAHRLVFQMAHRQPGCCVMLTHQTRVDTQNSIVCFHNEPNGIPGSILFPRLVDGKLVQYDASIQGPGEDSEFWRRNFGDKRVVIENDPSWFPGPLMMVCCWHGLNAKSREEFLGEFSDVQRYKGMKPDAMDEGMVKYLQATLRVFGLDLGTDRVEGPAAMETPTVQ